MACAARGSMSAPIFTRSALDDLQEIWCYVAEHNASAADALEADVYDAANQIAVLSTLGHRRADLTSSDVWFVLVRKNYLVVYRKSDPIEIIRVLHGARDVKATLDE